MSDYDFHQLSPHDLETLTRDLLQAHWKITIESFKSEKTEESTLDTLQVPTEL